MDNAIIGVISESNPLSDCLLSQYLHTGLASSFLLEYLRYPWVSLQRDIQNLDRFIRSLNSLLMLTGFTQLSIGPYVCTNGILPIDMSTFLRLTLLLLYYKLSSPRTCKRSLMTRREIIYF